MVPQSKRIHPSRSTEFDIENASADKVDLTTRAIFLDTQVRGLSGAFWFFAKSRLVAQTIVPWNEANCFELANDASPKAHMGQLIYWNVAKAQFHMTMFLSFPENTISK